MEIIKEKALPRHINTLPAENVGQVLRELSVADRLACMGVSPHWRANVRELGWTALKKLSAEIVFEGANDRQKEKFDTESLIALFRYVRDNLMELDLESFFACSPKITQDIHPSLELLQKLAKLTVNGFKQRESVDFLPKTLVELILSGNFDEHNLTTLSKSSPNLKSIVLRKSDSDNKLPVSMVNEFFENYQGLKILHLRGNFIESELNVSLTSLGQLHQLQALHLEGVSVFDDAALTAVATGCRRLRTLELNRIGVSEEALGELESLPNLLNFELKNHPTLNATIQTEFIGRWKTKKYKYLRSRMLTDHGFILAEVLHEITSAFQFTNDDLIQWGILPLLIKSLSYKSVELQFHAVSLLAKIIARSSERTGAVVEAGAVPELLKLLSSESKSVLEQSLWSLGNIIDDRSEFRDNCVELGIVELLLKMVDEGKPTKILQSISWVFACICRLNDPPLPIDIVQAISQTLRKFINNDDERVLSPTVWAFVCICRGGSERIQLVIDLGIVPRIVAMLDHSNEEIQRASLCAVGSFFLGTREQVQLLRDLGVLKMMPELISHTNEAIVKAIMKEMTINDE